MSLALREVRALDMTMRDGVRLTGDLYRPVEGRHPVLVMRQPYGRKIGSTVVLAHPAWYAAQGYLVLVQDVRGRGDSEGLFRVLEDDVEDGAATLALARDLDGGDGRVASYGFSYHGMNQYMALAGGGAPDAMAIVMAAFDVRDHWAYEGGAFRLALGRMWARQMAVETARRAGDLETAARLASDPAALPEARHTHYFDWLADDPAYWARVSPARRLPTPPPDVPVLHIGGWHDIMLAGTLAAHSAFPRSRLIVGPHAHIPWGRRLGALDGGEPAAEGFDREIVAFFDHVLKGREDNLPAVRLYDAGVRGWRDFAGWPQAREETLHLVSTGRAAASTRDGALAAAPSPFVDYLVHDPWRPAPCVGGALGTPGLYADRSGVDDRADVWTFTSAPLTAPVTLAGSPLARLSVTSDRPSFDLHLSLSNVTPDGAAVHICGAHRTLSTSGPVEIALGPCCQTFPTGARLRISVQAAAFPAFAVNPGTGRRAVEAGPLDALVTTLTLTEPSSLTLPILEGSLL
jgi:putative CocE/NonD family hydrolase